MDIRQAAKVFSQFVQFAAWREKQAAKHRKRIEAEEAKIAAAKRRIAEARGALEADLSKGRSFSEAESLLIGAFMADPDRREIRQAPKPLRTEISRRDRRIETLDRAVRDGTDYIKRLRKSGALRDELPDIVKTNEGKAAELAEEREERERLAAQLARAEAAHQQAWDAWIADLLAEGEQDEAA